MIYGGLEAGQDFGCLQYLPGAEFAGAVVVVDGDYPKGRIEYAHTALVPTSR